MCPKSFVFEGSEVRIVPRESIDGRAFYVSRDGKKGCNVMKNGVIKKCNATATTSSNCTVHSNAIRKQRYLTFHDVLGHHRDILVSHAVWLAWSGKPIPEGHQMHHLNGIVTDNRLENIVCLSREEHRRYDAVHRALRMSGRLETMTSEEILAVSQQYVLDHRPLNERMKDEPFRDFDPFIERDNCEILNC